MENKHTMAAWLYYYFHYYNYLLKHSFFVKRAILLSTIFLIRLHIINNNIEHINKK